MKNILAARRQQKRDIIKNLDKIAGKILREANQAKK